MWWYFQLYLDEKNWMKMFKIVSLRGGKNMKFNFCGSEIIAEYEWVNYHFFCMSMATRNMGEKLRNSLIRSRIEKSEEYL